MRLSMVSQVRMKKTLEHKIVNIFLPIRYNTCLIETGSYEYPQHTFWWRNKKNIFFCFSWVYDILELM